MLTVTTLGFALAAPIWLLTQPWMLGDGQAPGKPVSWPIAGPLDTGREYYYFALALFVVSLFLARNIRRSGFGRLLVAVRDNEDNARAFTVRASLVKLQGFLVPGSSPASAARRTATPCPASVPGRFPTSASIDVVVMTVLGGVSALIGPVLGAVWVLGLPLLDIGTRAGGDEARCAAPHPVEARRSEPGRRSDPRPDREVHRPPARDRSRTRCTPVTTRRTLPRRARRASGSATCGADRPDTVASKRPAPPAGTALLEARDLRKSFGGVHAVAACRSRCAPARRSA